MQIRFYKASEFDNNIKCSIHKSGRLGFSENAIKKLNLDSSCHLLIGKNVEDPNDENLYMEIERGEKSEGFKLIKAGAYYYANTKPLFDNLKIDYISNTHIYNIIDFEFEGETIFKLIKKDVPKRKKED